MRLSSDVRFQPASEPIDYRHTATPADELALCNQSVEYMCRMRELFNVRKAGPPRPPPHKSMAQALKEWGVTPCGRAAL